MQRGTEQTHTLKNTYADYKHFLNNQTQKRVNMNDLTILDGVRKIKRKLNKELEWVKLPKNITGTKLVFMLVDYGDRKRDFKGYVCISIGYKQKMPHIKP